MNIRPDLTFHPSPKPEMQAPVEDFAYVLMLNPKFSRSDEFGIVDVKQGSKTLKHECHFSRYRLAPDCNTAHPQSRVRRQAIQL